MIARQREFVWAILATLLVLAFAVGGWLRDPAPRLIKRSTNLPSGQTVDLGQEFGFEFYVETSWRRRPGGDLRLELPEGLAPGPEIGTRLRTAGWGTCRWLVYLPLRAHRSGTFPAGKLVIPCGDTALELEIPPVTVSLAVPADPLPETAPMPPPDPGKPWLGWVLTVAIFALIWRFRKRGNPRPPVSPAPVADDPLADLRDRVEAPDAALFGRLCDLVAAHLQETHAVPATGLTLREQAAWLSQTQSLPASLAEPLLELWQMSERVRFAGVPPTVEQARAALRATEGLLARNRGKRS
ncbi:MAG: hypothetical protein RBU25_09040 [Lentisphaeria bacterium]|jgi:hypothetical protein|nr:hypothetical protein [Lentisphaeria bacterium]